MRKVLSILLPLFLFLAAAGDISEAAIDRDTVTRAWKRVSAQAGIEYKPVNFENKKEPNAWVKFSPGNHSVHVTSGLMAILDREDEIAGIMAHEAGHIQLGHYKSSVGRNLLWGLLFSALDGNVAGEIAGGVGIALAESGFSREQEVEADDYGIRVSSAAGYSPWGLVNAMEKMKSAGYKTSPNGFNSHPPTDRRLLRLRNNASAIEPRKK
ncbi:MAG: M48 family metallopeptidase [Synergistaceae bacterium]|jgi:putative metalloprotease|uniref:M48 family metallopeptidase n=1 Tax=Aminivibrio sp. TaxID=1872489 RepID=UPI0016B4D6D8|nr:M48 family metallopeptidase [Synergistaceae bacterium]NCC58067.1 M48 family metallopeptidase [Synergistales bacterium]MDD3391455.1 M48 family metallopeptidase [Synergistaceae bacterium]MDD3689290.1 M48 family metallopeptidase [Synergistaceae bacterium]MDD4020635.1 M48 family metallopeptidase [Synergistaceae bacterium]